MRKLYELMSAEGLLPKVTFFAYQWMLWKVTGLVQCSDYSFGASIMFPLSQLCFSFSYFNLEC